MALVKCPECGLEISDTAKNCPHCGYEQKSIKILIAKSKGQYKKIVLSAAIVIILLFAVNVLARPNIKMDDFDIDSSKIATLLFLGVPSEVDGSEWEYEECGIKFYGIPVKNIFYDFSGNRYSMIFESEYRENVQNVLSEHCEYSRSYILRFYTYNELSVTYDGAFDQPLVFVNIS